MSQAHKHKLSNKARKIFETHYHDLSRSLFWYINKKINRKETAEDFTADVMMKLIEHEEILLERDFNGIRAWLFTVARNYIIDSFRKLSNRSKNVDLENEIFEIVTSHDEKYLDKVIQDEQYQMLLAAMESLTSEEKEVIDLRFKSDMKFAEIGEVLNKQEGAVKMIVYRALEKMKVKLKIHDQEA